jgi:hypothetical protein
MNKWQFIYISLFYIVITTQVTADTFTECDVTNYKNLVVSVQNACTFTVTMQSVGDSYARKRFNRIRQTKELPVISR